MRAHPPFHVGGPQLPPSCRLGENSSVHRGDKPSCKPLSRSNNMNKLLDRLDRQLAKHRKEDKGADITTSMDTAKVLKELLNAGSASTCV